MPVTGAYCYSLQNNYNGTRRPPVVLVRDGAARLAVRREEFSDLLARDVLEDKARGGGLKAAQLREDTR
jgi:diaminopimelate decarboxylase